MPASPDIFPIGDSALTVDFGRVISERLNDLAIDLAERLNTRPFPGMIEAVPAYASTTVVYNPEKVRSAFPEFRTAYQAVTHLIDRIASERTATVKTETDSVVIGVDFSSEAAVDIEELCRIKGISRDEFISIFTSRPYRVYMLGFLPGFAYMGEVDERIAVPRRVAPRLSVPKGSVGIAGTQTGIYSVESPGGWQIIGRTDFELLRFDSGVPCSLKPGNVVKFVDIAATG